MSNKQPPIPAQASPDAPARLDVLVPLEALAGHVPPALDGSCGRNRRTGDQFTQTSARNDLEAIEAFLADYQHNQATATAYRRELERFALWAMAERGKPISSLDHEDLSQYRAFLADLPPAWCGPRTRRFLIDTDPDAGQPRKLPNPDWRPFSQPRGRAGLAPASIQHALTVVNTFLDWLVRAGYLHANPYALVSGPAGRQALGASRTVTRYFNEIQLQAIWDTCEARIEHTPMATDAWREAHRDRFAVAVLYYLGLRAGEAATHGQHDFEAAGGHYWFRVVGKGGTEARVPVPPTLLGYLRGFRSAWGWPGMPWEDAEPRPLLPSIRGHRRGISARRLHQVLKSLFRDAAARIEATHPGDAAGLRQGSPHWLRHTSATNQLQAGISAQIVQQNLRHKAFSTTERYIHILGEEQQEAAKKFK